MELANETSRHKLSRTKRVLNHVALCALVEIKIARQVMLAFALG